MPPQLTQEIVILDNEMYLIGGYNGVDTLNTIDIYNIRTNRWRTGVSMNIGRLCPSVIVLDGKIYAVNTWIFLLLAFLKHECLHVSNCFPIRLDASVTLMKMLQTELLRYLIQKHRNGK